ncbi:MAG: 4Fe-4S dicluster domain-containing protein [Candidatus Lokiarchaeota archaeon]|nr:4Fe-4S dicluster domain-containing protein [Candidatus Lokiarchaeota archaeon]MBD3338952.1 4Fe-4S dicluster domain-containing protein [Candidatus Lokiarchaeota archaeon]
MREESKDIYEDLQKHLDKMPVGFPKSESGVEMKLLKSLFTPEEANIGIKLNFMPNKLQKIHRKLKSTGISLNTLREKLDSMVKKGLIMKLQNNDDVSYYNVPFLIGIWEMQLGSLTPKFAKNSFKYFYESYFENGYNKTGIPQMRTIPIEKAVEDESSVAMYDQVRKVLNKSDFIAVQECICRIGKDLIGEPCKKTNLRENCIAIGSFAKMRVENGLARNITKEEALEILEVGEKDGLVLQPSNSQKPLVICSCCGCCCEVLSSQRRFDNPSKLFATNFYAETDYDKCIGCGTCIERCNMNAILFEGEKSRIDTERCIGCGLCVSTCLENAISLIKKNDEIVPPRNTVETYMTILNKKAKLSRKNR